MVADKALFNMQLAATQISFMLQGASEEIVRVFFFFYLHDQNFDMNNF